MDGNGLLTLIENSYPRLGQYLRRYVNSSIENVARSVGTSSTGIVEAPQAPQSITVKASGEQVHVAISHNAPTWRNIRYFTDVATNPNMANPLTIDHGSSRTSHPFTLPSLTDEGDPQSYYFQSYAQYPGSPPSAKTRYESPITLSGPTKMTLLASRGSGTASPNGSQGGQGLGNDLFRPALEAQISAQNGTGGGSGPTPPPPPLPSGITELIGDVLAGPGTGLQTATVVSTHLTSPLPIIQGGTGTSTPSLVAGTGVTITGSWPDQTVSASTSTTYTPTFEIPTGTLNGLNTTFTVAFVPKPPGNPQWYLNGVLQVYGVDITISGQTGTFTVAPIPSDNMYAYYTH